nr:MAG TPA: hypothetical protein [Caudoviricetes sp.]
MKFYDIIDVEIIFASDRYGKETRWRKGNESS